MTLQKLLQKAREQGRLGIVGIAQRVTSVAERWRGEGGEAIHFKGDFPAAIDSALESAAKGETSFLLLDGFRFLDALRLIEEHMDASAEPLVVMQGIEVETYPKTLWMGIAPHSKWDNSSDVSRGISILVKALETLGEPTPRVALLSCVETVSPGIPSTVWEAEIAQMGQRGEFGAAIVDGPLGFDLAISPEAVRDKGVQTRVGGRADLLIPPDLNTYCSLVDSLHLSGERKSAGLVLGAPCPIALPWRYADEEDMWRSVIIANLQTPRIPAMRS
ncbi:MAG: phosphate acyltransferase [bacterium]